MIQHRQEYDDEEEYYYYDYEPESSCPPGELKVQVILPFRRQCEDCLVKVGRIEDERGRGSVMGFWWNNRRGVGNP